MSAALSEQFEQLTLIRRPFPRGFSLIRNLVRRATSSRVDLYYSKTLVAWHAKSIQRKLCAIKADVVICVATSPLAAKLARAFPVIHVSDATFRLTRAYNKSTTALHPKLCISAEELERSAIQRAVRVVASSKWAADSMIADYGGEPSKISVIHWGANIPTVHRDQILPHSGNVCRLLFVATDWERKGGDIALETAQILKDRDFDFSLEIVGQVPSHQLIPSKVLTNGFLRKSDPREHVKLCGLFQNASFLFLPTRRDCTPMVFAEANAYGVPAITRAVGGITDVVQDHLNGVALTEDSTASDFADKIMSLWYDKQAYQTMRANSRIAYETRLNWDAWALEVKQLVYQGFEEWRGLKMLQP